MTRWLGALALVLLAAGVAWAQLVPGQGALVPMTGPPCGMVAALVPNCGALVPNAITNVTPATPCTAGAIDLSLSTGCNIPFFVGAIFP